jgi:ribokinase
MTPSSIAVVGSLNIDYIAAVDRLPLAGETVPASQLIRRFGGKGANQAIAAARQGARVSMIGFVGAEDAGHAYRERLIAEGINTQGLALTTKALTGTALIAVDRVAENTIIVGAGANGLLGTANIRERRSLIESAAVLLIQFEIPMPSVIQAVRLANRAKVRVVLNPSPFREGFPWGECPLNTVITNAGETEAIFGRKVARLPGDVRQWQAAMRRRQIDRLLITRGAQPTLFITQSSFEAVPTMRVKPVDTVGAGDAFAGTFAARVADHTDVIKAIRYANCAGALATLKPGAQESIPHRRDVERALLSLDS